MSINRNETISLMQLKGGASLVGVQYLSNGRPTGNTYVFKNVLVKEKLVFGDFVVVEGAEGPALAAVAVPEQRLTVDVPLARLRHVISKVDMSKMNDLRMAEQDMVETLAVYELNAKLEEIQKVAFPGLDLNNMITPGLLGRNNVEVGQHIDTDQLAAAITKIGEVTHAK